MSWRRLWSRPNRRMLRKSDFLSRMSHEIRTPMNAIIGMSTIAAQSVGDDELVSDCISKIGISSRFLLSLINDILDMSRIESGKMLLKNERIPTEEFLVRSQFHLLQPGGGQRQWNMSVLWTLCWMITIWEMP